MKKFFYCALIALSTVFTGCYDDDDLWNKVDDLTERVENIEQVLAGLNGEISDMKTIVEALSKGAVITAYEETPTGYKLTFSDGKTIELKNGVNGIDGKDAPVIGVMEDTDGVCYWTITVNGKMDWLLDSEGNKIRVTGEDGKDGSDGQDGEKGDKGDKGDTGESGSDGKDGENGADGQPGANGADGKDGVTPVIGVDAEGYWTVDTGNGAERITDVNGNPVKAVGLSGDSFFNSVTIGEDEVTFVLSSGETFSVPRIDNFGITFDASDTNIEAGATKEFVLELTKVKTVFVASVTKDWEAVVKDEVLYITAPVELTDENTEGEINIIAANKRGDCRAFTIVCTAQPRLAILTFEDADAKFTAYTLDYAGVSVTKWSDLIDTAQYGGPLTYDYGGGTYTWNDENNTWLSHSFTTPYWGGGHAVSNYVLADYATLPEGHYGWYELQFTNPIGGHNGSSNFCVHNGYVDGYNTSLGYGAACPALTFSDGVARVVDHMYVTNINYVLNSLTYGDGFCAAASENSYFKVLAYGYDADGNNTGVVEFSLCNGTSLVTTWEKFDLSSLGKVVRIEFNMDASEDFKGSYGLNAPAYFAYDDVAVRM